MRRVSGQAFSAERVRGTWLQNMNVNTNLYQKYKTQGQSFAKVIEKKLYITQMTNEIWSDLWQPRRQHFVPKKSLSLKKNPITKQPKPNATYKILGLKKDNSPLCRSHFHTAAYK